MKQQAFGEYAGPGSRMSSTDDTVQIHTDGASRGNPGPGGYGIILQWGNYRKELSAGYRLTTNNRMELMGVIVALRALKKAPFKVLVYTDSRYIVDSLTKGWVWNWQKKGFRNKKNADLWQELIPLYRRHQVSLRWVKGHDSDPLNNRCDELATRAADSTTLLIDTGYEQVTDTGAGP